ncbi:hypothetical protein ACXZ9C_10860 [Streptococcus agalactiae]
MRGVACACVRQLRRRGVRSQSRCVVVVRRRRSRGVGRSSCVVVACGDVVVVSGWSVVGGGCVA